jgi:hypothetical protein
MTLKSLALLFILYVTNGHRLSYLIFKRFHFTDIHACNVEKVHMLLVFLWWLVVYKPPKGI